jgi:hypothetical protein
MKTSRYLLIGLTCLAGCSSLDYRAYTGAQPRWPTSQGAFVEVKDNIPIFHALPDKPYMVLGYAAMVDKTSGDLAKLVKKQHGDAGIISNERILTTGTRYVPGLSFTFGDGTYNDGWFNSSSTTITTPGRVENITMRVATGYVIKFKDPVRAKLDDLRSAIEWADANPYGATVGGAFITADQILAGEKQLLKNLNLWIAWCDQHPSGGSFPDAAGNTINVPAETIGPTRAELQKHREHLQSKFGEAATP